MRIYKREVQQKVLEIVGISPEEVSTLLHCIWACGEITIISTVNLSDVLALLIPFLILMCSNFSSRP